MLTHLKFSNVRAFSELSLDLRPLTVLLGPNNSGKSAVLVPLRLLAQTVRAYDPDVSLLLNGPLGEFGSYRDLVYGNKSVRPIKIELGVSISRGIPSMLRPPGEMLRVGFGWKYLAKRRELIQTSYEVCLDERCLLKTKYARDSDRQILECVDDAAVPPHLKASLSEDLRFAHGLAWPFGVGRSGKTGKFLTKARGEALRAANRAGNVFRRELSSLEYLGPLRKLPERTYLFSGERRAFVGIEGENTAQILVADASRAEKRSRQILQRASRWMAQAGIAAELLFKPLTERHYELRVKHPLTGEDENIADVGLGNSQVLPVIVAGYNLSRGTTLLVEQPELHLHPRAQAELGDFFVDLYSRQVQTIVETHSEYLILRLQQAVAAKRLEPDDVAVYYVSVTEGEKHVTRMRIDASGTFTSPWPEGFFPERLEEATELAKLRASQH